MLGGGPASQHPRYQTQQIRRRLPRAVTLQSSRYPQLLWVYGSFRAASPAIGSECSARVMLNVARTPARALFINSKPQLGLAGGGSESVKRRGCILSARQRRLSSQDAREGDWISEG